MHRIRYTILVIVLASLTSSAKAHWIGFYSDESSSSCELHIPSPYVSVRIYVSAILLAGGTSITGAEFGMNPTEFTDYALLTGSSWSSDSVEGDLAKEGGMSITWVQPMSGPIVQIGHIDYLILNMFPANHEIYVQPHSNTGKLIVLDEIPAEIPVEGFPIVINCSGDCFNCIPATDDSS